MPPQDNLHTQVAVMETELRHIRDNVDKIEGRLDNIDKTLAEIQQTLAHAKGGWKAIAAAGAIGGAIVGVFAKLGAKLFN